MKNDVTLSPATLMKLTSDIEEVLPILLTELNQRRARQGRAPLDKYPEDGCTDCGERGVGPLFVSNVSYIRTCQGCVLKQVPFSKLRLAPGETITWYRSNPTFHRLSDYGIVVTNSAVYLSSPAFHFFSRWRRISISEIQSAAFNDSGLFPSLRIQTTSGTAILRTLPDYGVEMKIDRQNLREAAEQVRSLIPAHRETET
jgi:hypothetical protein